MQDFERKGGDKKAIIKSLWSSTNQFYTLIFLQLDFFQWILNACYYTIHICVTHLRRSIMDLDSRLKMCLLQIKASTRYCMFFKLLTKFKNSLKIKISVISCGTCKWSIKIWLWKVRHILRNKSKYSQTCISPDIN